MIKQGLIIEGEIKYIEPPVTKEYSGKKYTTQTFVVDTAEDYNPYFKLVVFGDKGVAQVAQYAVGDYVECVINVKCREYTAKATGKLEYFIELQPWKISRVADQSQIQSTDYSQIKPATDKDYGELPF